MGDEAPCAARVGGRASEGKALLETDELVFRGDFRLRIPFRDVRSVSAEDGLLRLEYGEGTATFELGAKAERWAERIRNPKTRLDKLGVKAESRVAVLAVDDADFRRELGERVGTFVDGAVEPGTDVVFLGAARLDLDRLGELEPSLGRDGAVWVVAPRGGAEPREADVLAAGRAAGLVDTKVVRFSATHTAHRFVVPHARR